MEDRSKVSSVPPKVPPEGGFHSGVKAENALFSDDRLQDIHRSGKRTRLVLKPRSRCIRTSGFSKLSRPMPTYLIFTSSNGTTTNDSVALKESSETQGSSSSVWPLTLPRSPSGRRAVGSSFSPQRGRGRSCPRSHLQRSKEISPRERNREGTLAHTIW